ncbi:TerD family protein [Pseudonocardia sichuanensis]
MQTLAKGANAPLPPGPVAVRVSAGAAVDVSALLVTASGKVRGDADFVFYNQPEAPGVRYRPDGVDVEPAAVEPGVEKVVVTASLDTGTFGTLGPLRLEVAVGGVPVAVFEPGGLGAETALLCVEVYRRDQQWKVRAVGQGYASGLAGIATDFGITVEDEPVPVPTPKVTLDKGRVSLEKRQTVSLTKGGAPALRRVAMGLGWDPAARGRSVDLDASAILVGTDGRKADAVWFMSKQALDGRVQHSGDNLTGHGAGDDETITVDLEGLPGSVAAIVFVVNSFQGQEFTAVAGAYCRLVDLASGAELVRFDLTESAPRTGVVMSVLRRAGAAWEMTAIGEFHDGRSARSMFGVAEEVVRGLT